MRRDIRKNAIVKTRFTHIPHDAINYNTVLTDSHRNNKSEKHPGHAPCLSAKQKETIIAPRESIHLRS